MSTKKLIKQALKQPHLFTPEELHYMQMVRAANKRHKKVTKLNKTLQS
jgi:hypothetical protein